MNCCHQLIFSWPLEFDFKGLDSHLHFSRIGWERGRVSSGGDEFDFRVGFTLTFLEGRGWERGRVSSDGDGASHQKVLIEFKLGSFLQLLMTLTGIQHLLSLTSRHRISDVNLSNLQLFCYPVHMCLSLGGCYQNFYKIMARQVLVKMRESAHLSHLRKSWDLPSLLWNCINIQHHQCESQARTT